MTPHYLDLIDIGCARGDRPLFVGVNQHVAAGELLHVAGSNGSGKTTLLRTVCGLSRPAEGEIRWRSVSIRKLGDEYRQDLAYLGHKDGIQGELTPTENLWNLACTMERVMPDAIAHALERLGLAAYRAFPAKILSQGQKRRLALARLLVLSKPLWILDEPFTALDVASCQLITEILSDHLKRGGTAIISSHQAFDVPTATLKRIDLDKARTNNPPVGASPAARPAASRRYPA